MTEFATDSAIDDAATKAIWREMEEFLHELEAAGSPKTAKQRRANNARYTEILKRCCARAVEYGALLDRNGSGTRGGTAQ